MEKTNEKSCKNCLHKSNCLIRSATLYQLYIASGRFDELTEDVKKEADLLLSLSPLTFTHELARLLLSEQLFRASNILAGGSYHNE